MKNQNDQNWESLAALLAWLNNSEKSEKESEK